MRSVRGKEDFGGNILAFTSTKYQKCRYCIRPENDGTLNSKNTTMSKSQDAKKSVKKEPAKTPKEKKAEKREKKAKKG